jgi:hypothetical protein
VIRVFLQQVGGRGSFPITPQQVRSFQSLVVGDPLPRKHDQSAAERGAPTIEKGCPEIEKGPITKVDDGKGKVRVLPDIKPGKFWPFS